MEDTAEETFNHPTQGVLVKKSVYTFDETIYPTVQDAIIARAAFVSELNVRQGLFDQAVIDLQNNVITEQQFLVIKNGFILWQETAPKGWTKKDPFIEASNDDVDFKQKAFLNAMILNRTI